MVCVITNTSVSNSCNSKESCTTDRRVQTWCSCSTNLKATTHLKYFWHKQATNCMLCIPGVKQHITVSVRQLLSVLFTYTHARLRQALYLHIQLYHTTIRQNTARYRGVRIWNSLDDALYNIVTMNRFKSAVKISILLSYIWTYITGGSLICILQFGNFWTLHAKIMLFSNLFVIKHYWFLCTSSHYLFCCFIYIFWTVHSSA